MQRCLKVLNYIVFFVTLYLKFNKEQLQKLAKSLNFFLYKYFSQIKNLEAALKKNLNLGPK